MREKNSERPDTRDNRSKNSTKTGKKKKNTKNQEFAVITYSFLALFICLMGYFSYFQFFKSEEFINNPYNTRQETFTAEDCDTFTGFVFQKFGMVPKDGDTKIELEIENMHIIIDKIKEHQVEHAIIEILE